MNESNIPIDINIGKLQDWLISRRHVNRGWQSNIVAVREKINSAIQDMPVHDGIAKLLSGSYINYFHCLKIVNILKETEADSKNMFGRYGSQRMKDWQDVIKHYEKENLYLAEAAQMLVRNINYEIPSIKKQILKQEQVQTECHKKEGDYAKTEAATRAEFLASCKQLGIQGDKIKRELVERLIELPDIYKKIGESLRPLLPAIELYEAFLKHILGDKKQAALPLLKYTVEHGNTTVYEWSYGEPPLTLEPDPLHIDFEDEEEGQDNIIDFGDDLTSDVIDFGSMEAANADTIDISDSASGEIDWGNIGNVNDTDNNQEISLEIAEISLEESGIVVEGDGVAGGVARGKDALTLLDSPSTRTLFVDQLVELESFLKMRLYETASSNDSNFLSLFQDVPMETCDSLTAMLDAVQVILSQLMDTKLCHLHNVKHSPRYVDILTAQLKQKLSLGEKIAKLIAKTQQKRVEAQAQEASLRPVLALIMDKTRELQADIESDISKKYKNRPVNVIGGVNFL